MTGGVTGGTAANGLEPVLAGEHAAVYGYGVAGAVLVRSQAPVTLIAAARAGFDAHRETRDRLIQAIASSGLAPVAASPAYRLPFPVTDTGGALRLLIVLEDRLCATCATAVGACSSGARTLAADVLSAAAIRAFRLRLLAGLKPAGAVRALPGIPASG